MSYDDILLPKCFAQHWFTKLNSFSLGSYHDRTGRYVRRMKISNKMYLATDFGNFYKLTLMC